MVKKSEDIVQKTTKRRVTFTLEAPAGKIVCVAGSFNNWDPTKKQLTYKADKGVYTGTITLEPGSYDYKFVVDDEWLLDENNPNFNHNDFGTLNSMIIVD